MDVDPFELPPGSNYILKRSNPKVNVWETQSKSTAILVTNNEAKVTFTSNIKTVWVEFVDYNGGDSFLELKVKTSKGKEIDFNEKLHFYSFNSIVIAFGGATHDPVNLAGKRNDYGTFVSAVDLYNQGYDVHMYQDTAFVGNSEAYHEVVNAIRYRGVTEVAIFGYSHGGGTTFLLADELINNENTELFGISYTAYIDAVGQPGPFAEKRRPPGTAFHVNYFQPNCGTPESPFCGRPTEDCGRPPTENCDDILINVSNKTWGTELIHGNIDDDFNVRNGVMDELKNRVKP